LNDGRSEEDLSELNQRLLESLNQTGKVFFTHTSLRGKYVLRMVVAQRKTEERQVKAAWELIVSQAKDLLK
jgi:aromatic-L-amino-acid decarboxylase